jgi:hypothetical protein
MEWISVNEKLPEIRVKVKVKVGCMGMGGTKYHETIGYVTNEHGRFNVGFDWCRVAFWMPLDDDNTSVG